MATLTNELMSPTQQYVTPATLWSPISSVAMQPDGSAFIITGGGMLNIEADGSLSSQANRTGPNVTINPVSVVLVLGESVAALAMGILLIVAGAGIFRNSARSRRLHLIYAAVKIPLCVIATVGVMWLFEGFDAGVPASSIATNWRQFIMTVSIGGVIYPVILLIVLNLPSVRSYFRAVATAD